MSLARGTSCSLPDDDEAPFALLSLPTTGGKESCRFIETRDDLLSDLGVRVRLTPQHALRRRRRLLSSENPLQLLPRQQPPVAVEWSLSCCTKDFRRSGEDCTDGESSCVVNPIWS